MPRVTPFAVTALFGLLLACGSPGSDAPNDAPGQPQPADLADAPPQVDPAPTPPPPADADPDPEPAPEEPPALPLGPSDRADYPATPVSESLDTVGVLPFLAELEMVPVAREWATWHADWAETFRDLDTDPYQEGPEAFGAWPRWCLRAFAVEAQGAADSTMARVMAGEPSRRTLEDLARVIQNPVVLRRFYFYGGELPAVPDDYALPPFSPGIDYHLSNCRLGLVSAEVIGAERKGEIVAALMSTYEHELGGRVGTEGAPQRLDADGSTWRDGQTTVGVGQRRRSGDPVTYAFLPIIGTAAVVGRDPYLRTRAWEAAAYEMAYEASALSEEVAELIASFEAREEPPYQVPPDFREKDELVYEIIGRITERPAGLDGGSALADTVAARYMTADLFLHRHYGNLPLAPYGLPESTWEDFQEWLDALPAKYAALGVQYESQEWPEPEYVYRPRSLADSAAAIGGASGGWGDLARLLTFEQGCTPAPVLEEGPAVLERIREPRFVARLNLLLGDAYATLIFYERLGRRTPVEVHDIEETRRLAREHYIAALEGELDEGEKPWAWRHAWALTHNLPAGGRWDCPGPA